MITADCPVGTRAILGRRLRRAFAVGPVVPAMLVAGLTSAVPGRRRIPNFPTGPGATWSDRADWALTILGIRQEVFKGETGDLIPIPGESKLGGP